MVSATGDWTTNTLEREYPAVRALYALQGAADRVHAVRFDAPHNYNRESREAVYAWMARWLQNAPADVRREERAFTADPLPDLLVFHRRQVPQNAVDAAQLTTNWIDAARRQLSSTPLEVRARALRQALGFGPPLPASRVAITPSAPVARTNRRRQVTVIVAGIDAELEKEFLSAKFILKPVDFTPFDAEEAAKIPFFDTYNRTAASQRVAESSMRCARRRMPCSWWRVMRRWRACLRWRLKRNGGPYSTSAISIRRTMRRFSTGSTCRAYGGPAISRLPSPGRRPRRDPQRGSPLQPRRLIPATREADAERDRGAIEEIEESARIAEGFFA